MKSALRVATRYLARFKPPRAGFGDPEVERAAREFTQWVETKLGHDLGDWKPRSKTDPNKFGWVSKCVKCGREIELRRGRMQYALQYDAKADASLEVTNAYPDDYETEGLCQPQAQEIIRGIFLELPGASELLTKSDSEVASAIVAQLKSRPVGPHWTNPTNRVVSENFAKKLKKNSEGIPVLMHAEFWLQDQRRNYKPGGFRALEDFHYESEINLSNKEVVRLTAIEWFDGQSWKSHKLPDLKVRTT